MTPSELEYKLKSLPPNTPITAEHIIAILGAMQAPQVLNNQPSAFSSWDSDKLIDTETLADWIGEIPNRLKKWRVDGIGPKFISKAKHVAYRVGDVRDWINSRTVQSTSQGDKLRLVCNFNSCFVEPIIYHKEKSYSLFESIEIFEKDDETDIRGFEVFITKGELSTLYMQSNFDELCNIDNLNTIETYFINGVEFKGTVSHLIAKYPKDNIREWLPELLTSGMMFSIKDSQDLTAIDYNNDFLNNYLEKWNMKHKFQEKFKKKSI